MIERKGHDWSPQPGDPIPIAQQTPGDIELLFRRMEQFEIIKSIPSCSTVYQFAMDELLANGAFQANVIMIDNIDPI